MAVRLTVEFVESSTPVRELVTKFGGQPVWVLQPQWPISAETGNPMRFIGQVALSQDIFGDIAGQMAYLFITDEDEYVDCTWEPDGGENAVVIQPGSVAVPTQVLLDGPSIYRMVARPGDEHLVAEPCEFRARLVGADDPEFLSEAERNARGADVNQAYYEAIAGTKVGGTPGFLQGDEFPGDEFRQLILQLDSSQLPFSVNFGDGGIGFAFLSDDGSAGRFLWQCT